MYLRAAATSTSFILHHHHTHHITMPRLIQVLLVCTLFLHLLCIAHAITIDCTGLLRVFNPHCYSGMQVTQNSMSCSLHFDCVSGVLTLLFSSQACPQRSSIDIKSVLSNKLVGQSNAINQITRAFGNKSKQLRACTLFFVGYVVTSNRS
jgi:hypothetical protein